MKSYTLVEEICDDYSTGFTLVPDSLLESLGQQLKDCAACPPHDWPPALKAVLDPLLMDEGAEEAGKAAGCLRLEERGGAVPPGCWISRIFLVIHE